MSFFFGLLREGSILHCFFLRFIRDSFFQVLNSDLSLSCLRMTLSNYFFQEGHLVLFGVTESSAAITHKRHLRVQLSS